MSITGPFPTFKRTTTITMLTDSFEDGDYTSNPTWTITSGAISVTTNNPRTGTYSIKGNGGNGQMKHVLASPNSTNGVVWKAYFYPTIDESGNPFYQLYDVTNRVYFRIIVSPQSSTTLLMEFSRLNFNTLTGQTLSKTVGYDGGPDYPVNGWGGQYWEFSMTKSATGFTAKVSDGVDEYSFSELGIDSFVDVEDVRVGVADDVHADDVDYGVSS